MQTKQMVSVDFWNTLVDPSEGGDERYNARLTAIREVASQNGKNDLEEEQVANTFEQVSEHFSKIWLQDHVTPKPDMLTKKLLNHLGIKANNGDVEDLSNRIQFSLLEGPPAVAPNAADVLEQLSKKYCLIIISDTMYTPGKVLRKYLEEKELSGFFSGYIFSDEMGFSKPDTRAFNEALKIAGSEPATSFHIGDLEHTDIAGAKASDMKAILYTGLGTDEPEETAADYICADWSNAGELLL